MSTVSGGGYIGSFLGRFYDRLRTSHAEFSSVGSASGPSGTGARVTRLANVGLAAQSWQLHLSTRQWRRTLNAATFFRNLLSVHLVIGLAAFAVFGTGCAIRFGVFEKLLAGYGLVVSSHQMPIGHLLHTWLGPWLSPWLMVAELIVLFLVLPRIVGYWVVSPDKHESFKPIPL